MSEIIHDGNAKHLDAAYEKNIRQVFNVLDHSKSGKVSREDLARVMAAFGQKVTGAELDDIIAKRDRNHDGAVDFEDFKALLRDLSVDDSHPLLPFDKLVQRLVLNEDVVSRSLRLREKSGFLCDMDGVIYRGPSLIPGVRRFLSWIASEKKSFLFITNNSRNTPMEISAKLANMGLAMPPEKIYTAAIACAEFLVSQKPHGCSAYCLGDKGMVEALKERGVEIKGSMEDSPSVRPDYVVVAESLSYTVEEVNTAATLVMRGSKLIGASPDPYDRLDNGIEPSCGAWTALIEKACNKKAYFTGKPNPWMMQSALARLGLQNNEVAMVGDRMDTDIIGGLESRIDPVLVLSGVTQVGDIDQFAWRPYLVLNNVGEIPPEDFASND